MTAEPNILLILHKKPRSKSSGFSPGMHNSRPSVNFCQKVAIWLDRRLSAIANQPIVPICGHPINVFQSYHGVGTANLSLAYFSPAASSSSFRMPSDHFERASEQYLYVDDRQLAKYA
jgi:hypothetical protein